jgi:NAD(P)-dependent dehydrogenase (short-subunit alcohol dehydrogenase family)
MGGFNLYGYVGNSPVNRIDPKGKELEDVMLGLAVLGAALSAPEITTQAAVKHLGEGASIINIGSGASRITPANSVVYTGTKGAVDAITGALARELGPRKIRVNSVNPGPVQTEGTDAAGLTGSDFEKSLIAQTPLGRVGQVGDIAPIAVFLASDESAQLTGEVILATGGIRGTIEVKFDDWARSIHC